MIMKFANGEFDVNIGDTFTCDGSNIYGCSSDVTDRTDVLWKVEKLFSAPSDLPICAKSVTYPGDDINDLLHATSGLEGEEYYYFHPSGLVFQTSHPSFHGHICYYCGQLHAESKLIDGRYICPDCMAEHTFTCIECGEVHDTRRRMKGIDLCRPCFDEFAPVKYARAVDDRKVYFTEHLARISDGSFVTMGYAEAHFVKCHICGVYEYQFSFYEKNNIRYCRTCANEKYPACGVCGRRHEPDEMTNVNGMRVCSTCLSREFDKCDFCGEYWRKYDLNITADTGKKVCSRCSREMICSDCRRPFEHLRDDPGKIVWLNIDNNSKSHIRKMCKRCELSYVPCTDCGALVYKNNCHAPDGKVYCGTHMKSRYTFCEQCCTWKDKDEEYHGDDDNRICNCCYESSENGTRGGYNGSEYTFFAPEGMQDYYYKPTPVFFPDKKGSGLFMGFELEVDGGNDYEDTLNCVNEILGITYAKHDGSLGEEGIEFVSHPATMEYYISHKDRLDKAMNYLKSMGYSSYTAETCGLHVHVSAFPLLYNTDNGIEKLLWFQDKYWDNLFHFSRRTATQVSDWANRITAIPNEPRHEALSKTDIIRSIKDAKKNAKNSGRYKSINLQNEKTVEFRIFAGTLNVDTFIATLQLVSNLCELALEKTFDQFRELTWEDVIAYKEYPELRAYWESRSLNECDREKYDYDAA